MKDLKNPCCNPSQGIVTPTTNPTGDDYGEKGISQGDDAKTIPSYPKASVDAAINRWDPQVK